MTTAPLPTWTLSGFGDEIDEDPTVQVAVLQALGARHIELRSAWGINVVDFSAEQLEELGAVFADRGMRVSAIASPVGKVDVTLPVEAEVGRLGRAIAAAHALDSRYIRIFSFFRAPGVDVASIRDDVLLRMRALADLAEKEGVILLHENEKDIYGDIPARVLDLIESVGSDALRVAWDSANFVQVGVQPFTEGYRMLRPHLEYLQVKDAVAATGEVATVNCSRLSPPCGTTAMSDSRPSNRIWRIRTRSAASLARKRSAGRPGRSRNSPTRSGYRQHDGQH
jgi:sugar phosphate isomerase/epimerase